ncbi:MAG: IclR family transcriptional regulator [Candidatus Sumerlaeota bacterium]
MAETKPVQSLLRGIDILELLTESPEGMRLSDIAAAMDLKAPTVHNLVKTLSMRGLVEKRNGNQYMAGPGILDLAERLREQMYEAGAEKQVRSLASHPSAPLVNYTVPTAGRLPVRLRMSADRPGVMQRPRDHTNALYGSASGLAFLAFAPPDRVMLMRQRHPFHEEGVRLWESLEELESYLGNCRDRGYAATPFEGQELFRVAAPVHDAQGVAVAYIGAAATTGAAKDKKVRQSLVDAVVAAGATLSHQFSTEQ